MAYNRNQARAIATDKEYELFSASLADTIAQLTPVQLRAHIKRARTLRDKNTDLFQRQSLATQQTTGSKRGKSGAANQRTEQKAKLFDEVLKRFETRLQKIEARSDSAAAKPAPRRTAAAGGAAPAAPKKSAARTTKASAPAAAKKASPGVSPKTRVRTKVQAAHTRASNARSQAKRDKR